MLQVMLAVAGGRNSVESKVSSAAACDSTPVEARVPKPYSSSGSPRNRFTACTG